MKHRQPSQRRGTTMVEFALVVPIILLLFYGAFEYSRMSMVLHTVEMAAYEGARRGVVPGATADDAMGAANDTLAAVGVRNATVSVSPNPITLQTSQVTVEVQVSLDDNCWVTQSFLKGMRFDRSFTLGRENVSWGMTSQPPPPPPPQLASAPVATVDDNFNSGYGQNGTNSGATNSSGGNGYWGNGNGGGNWSGGNWGGGNWGGGGWNH